MWLPTKSTLIVKISQMCRKINLRLFTTCLLFFIKCAVFGQGEIHIVMKPFSIITNDSSYSNLNLKAPLFLCNGILYHSPLMLSLIYDNSANRLSDNIPNSPVVQGD